MIHLEERHKNIIKEILQKYPYTFYAFGSRVKGTQRKLSDLDICFIEPIPWHIRAHIDEDFEESNLPFTVDVIDWNKADKNFQTLVAPDLIMLQLGTSKVKL